MPPSSRKAESSSPSRSWLQDANLPAKLGLQTNTSSQASIEPFENRTLDPVVGGFLHRPTNPSGDALILTHGAGGNCQSALLIAVAEQFVTIGCTVLRCNLPFRQQRLFGPPRPGDAEPDREGLKNAVAAIQALVNGRTFLGGQSYGGRQASMLCADEPHLVSGLLLLSYPLHPPGKPAQLRTQHLPRLQVPVVFVQGTRDPFGSIEEMQTALKLITSPTTLLPVEGVGHDLGFKSRARTG